MTIEEFHEYSNIAIKLFGYMNGKINRLNSQCAIYVDMYDKVHGTYANIRYPNNITVYIGTIIDSWRDDYSIVMTKRDYIGTVIAWALAHELHHADQLLSMLQYNANAMYKQSVEGDVERASYNWVNMNRSAIEQVGGFKVQIESLDSKNLPDQDNCNYKKASIKEYYLQTIANIIIRDFDLYNKIKVFTNDWMVDDIILIFNDIDTVVIKSLGNYLPENINTFSNLAYKWAGHYDMYSIDARAEFSTIDNRNVATVKFRFSNQIIKPMIFKDNSVYGGTI